MALSLLTLLTVGGPLAMFAAISGGPSATWPPDRPFEWGVIVVVLVAFLALMAACLTVPLWSRPARGRPGASQRQAPGV